MAHPQNNLLYGTHQEPAVGLMHGLSYSIYVKSYQSHFDNLRLTGRTKNISFRKSYGHGSVCLYSLNIWT